MNFIFRKAMPADTDIIWEILQQAIVRRRQDGSQQWQDGYPNISSVKNDINKKWGYVLLFEDKIIAYGAIILNAEPAYKSIDGAWLTNEDFFVIHRVAVSNNGLGRGAAKQFFYEAEFVATSNKVLSIKVDTNYDNVAMLHILNKMGYIYCGKVMMRGAPRMAFEKVLENK